MADKAWDGFEGKQWRKTIDVRDFIQSNYTPYEGDSSFLEAATASTSRLWETVSGLMKQELGKGVLDADTAVPSTIVSHAPGYIDQPLEKIVGLQTDAPLKRAIMPNGGRRMVEVGLDAYGYAFDEQINDFYKKFRKTHNDGVFDAYTPDMRAARSAGIVTGLPDAYGRGRIIGDYRRVALYGIDLLMADKLKQKAHSDQSPMTEDVIRAREEYSEQLRALEELKTMGESYGFDLSRPAGNAQEAIQWTYLAYLAATKEQNGAAMSLGRVSSFFDIYLERDLAAGILAESEAQELVDHFVMKLRMIRFLRTPAYDELFSGDPTWVTECIGGMGADGRPLCTKSSMRFLHTVYNLGPAPEPNLTVLWSEQLPENFKKFCARVSIDTSTIQYESDDLMRPKFGDDYGIACCVSAMPIGKQMQFFGARCNLAKALLYAINGGVDDISGEQVGPDVGIITSDYLDYGRVMAKFKLVQAWLAGLYLNTLNVIHYMHDKYAYERIQMALHDAEVHRTLAGGIAGLSVVADAFSAMKHAKVRVIRNERGLAVDYQIEGEYPAFGNNDDRVDSIACELVRGFMAELRRHKAYRGAEPTMSILTITSNVVYGKKTGNTPDGRKAGEPFAPGANPMHGRDVRGSVASMASVAKLPYDDAEDGISYTFSIVPKALGKTEEARAGMLVSMLDAYFLEGGQHINVNVFDRAMLEDAMEHPELYPQLTIRVSGYAVNFTRLTREQQLDVINRTFHQRM
ncbi:Formate acetyltransferase [Pontiella desulfatans]|uniref:Formate acetyltransferase n=2 Tax=Pontiella desulfatans TaxID=2750659 RepID=A0A6C2U4C6_PONDE|nr:formate C-acetyltransferase [Pontiella desulfatans]VGO14830.1 Formate acetyltransferase [Pontiella desulfatans]